MKRNVGARKKAGRAVLNDSTIDNSFDANDDSTEDEAAKRHRLIQRRRSYIEMDKQRQAENAAPAGGSRTPAAKPGEKRHSQGNGMSSQDSGDSDDSNGENSLNQAQKNKRMRRRVSLKRRGEGANRISDVSALNLSYGNLNAGLGSPTVDSPVNKQPTDKKTLQDIYSTCSALFQAHKITPQNAFSLKLVECLDEIIQSDEFDKRNLPLLARTLEIGGKIYICRVDGAHNHTIKLATEIAQNQTEAAKQGEENGEAGIEEFQDLGDDGQVDGAAAKKKARTKAKKRSRFIEDNDLKLNTGFEDQSSKYATRRTSLKLKFHRNIDEEMDFDYLSYFLKPGETNPIEREEEHAALSNEGLIPESHINADEMKTIPWFAFNVLNEWDPSKFDLWGIPLTDSDPMELLAAQQRPASAAAIGDQPDDNEFAYNPDNRPEEYPMVDPPDGPMASFGGDGDEFGDVFNDEAPAQGQRPIQPLNLDNLKSLDDLRNFFDRLKGTQATMKTKYGWAGPVFLKPQRTATRKQDEGKTKKAPRKKKTLWLKFDEIDWKDNKNRYIDGGFSKTLLDDKTLDKWANGKTTTAYCDPTNFMGYEEDEEEYRRPFDLLEGTDDLMANVTRFFIDSNRTIFQLMEEEFRQGKDVWSQSLMGEGGGSGREFDDDGLPEPELDIEAPRDFADDSGGNLMPLADTEPQTGLGMFDDLAAAGFNLSAMFPSVGYDGMSKASEFDSVKFSKQPKPIDMHALKRFIRTILTERLELNDEGRPMRSEETSVDLLSLITELMRRVDNRMAKHLSVAIVVVGLMHVVADNKLFMVTGTETPRIVCRGQAWRHKDHIPMATPEIDEE